MNRRVLRRLRVLTKLIIIIFAVALACIALSHQIHIEVTTLHQQTPLPLILVGNLRTETTTVGIQTVNLTSKPPIIVTTCAATNKSQYEFSDVIINPHPFNYIRIPSGICRTTGNQIDPLLLILVKSNVFQFGHRMAIRSTWGKLSDDSIQLAFLLGFSSLVQPFLKTEYDLYKDIIQEDFLDEYRNNTLKTIMGFNWAVTYCRQTKFILFVDDDYFVNIPNVKDFVQNIANQSTFVGYRYQKARPRRQKDSKWYVSTEEYNETFWPPYISGGSMILSMDVVVNMTKAFPFVKQLYIDDVYLGIVANLLNISVSHDKRFETRYLPDQLHTLFSSHEYGSPHSLIQEWKKINEK